MKTWTCVTCDKRSKWAKEWRWYLGAPELVTCSDECADAMLEKEAKEKA